MHAWTTALLALLPLIAAAPAPVAPIAPRTVDTAYKYTGPDVPIGDAVDKTIAGDGTGYIRVRMPPAVTPALGSTVTNNINVISSAYYGSKGINIHFQTPFGIGSTPTIYYGTEKSKLKKKATGRTHTYDRTPPCSMLDPTQCSQFFHEVPITGLKPGTQYYYQIPGGNGTTPSDILSFTTALEKGATDEFTVAVLADMGYENAKGTHERLVETIQDGAAFVWHGGDISYADAWTYGIVPCVLEGEDKWDVCYNGSSSTLPHGLIDNDDYYIPLPAGEIPSQGSPHGGDIATIYESNWDLWQQWMNSVTKHVPYMVAVGNHDVTCAEFDGPNDEIAHLLQANGTLNYYSCPPSQRNFTAYSHRFGMPGEPSGGNSNFWYSFDYGQAHFITFDAESDFYKSPSWSFLAEMGNTTHPTAEDTYVTDAGPMGFIDNNNYTNNKAYEQYQWLVEDLKSVDRTKTPWVFAMAHRPMYASYVSSYQANLRNAFQDLFIEYGVDAYIAGHIHLYERLWPLTKNGTVDTAAVLGNNSYKVNNGQSITHLISGCAGTVESHDQFAEEGSTLFNITAVMDAMNFGFGKLTVYNATTALWEFVHGADGQVGDWVYLNKDAGKKGKH